MSNILETVEHLLRRTGGIDDLRAQSIPLMELFAPDLWALSTGYSVMCPVCKSIYVHMKKFENVQSIDILHFEGECSQAFALVFEFHKGNTSAYFVREPDLPE